MKNIIFTALFATLSLITTSAQNFDDIVSRLAAANPEISALIKENNAVLESLKAENNLADPEIEGRSVWGSEGNKMGIGISQSFDWPGLYRARSEKIGASKIALSELYAQRFLDISQEIRLLAIDFIAAKRNYSYFLSVKQNMDSLRSKYAEAYSRGEVSVLDLNKVKIECLKVASRAEESRLRSESVRAQIAAISTDRDALALLDSFKEYPVEKILSEAEYEALIDRDPALAYFTAMADVAQKDVKIANMQALPSFSLGYEFEREIGNNFHGFSVSMSLPFFSKRHKKEAAISEKAAYEAKFLSAKISALSQMRDLRKQVRSLAERLQDFADILDGNNHLVLLDKALKGGEINLFTFIQEVNYFIDAQCDYEQLAYQYHSSLAKLNRLRGV